MIRINQRLGRRVYLRIVSGPCWQMTLYWQLNINTLWHWPDPPHPPHHTHMYIHPSVKFFHENLNEFLKKKKILWIILFVLILVRNSFLKFLLFSQFYSKHLNLFRNIYQWSAHWQLADNTLISTHLNSADTLHFKL